jgi:hypothetical protein
MRRMPTCRRLRLRRVGARTSMARRRSCRPRQSAADASSRRAVSRFGEALRAGRLGVGRAGGRAGGRVGGRAGGRIWLCSNQKHMHLEYTALKAVSVRVSQLTASACLRMQRMASVGRLISLDDCTAHTSAVGRSTSAPGPDPSLHICAGTGLSHPFHIGTGSGPTPVASAPGPGPPLPHLHRDRARRAATARYIAGICRPTTPAVFDSALFTKYMQVRCQGRLVPRTLP